MRSWGLPYKGSKSKIADKIVPMFPKAENLYDLFCGGCAISHFAMSTHRFKNVHINDVNWMCPTLFKDCLEGKYKDENRWISREDFERLKDKDPYVAFVWSFGNNLRDYLYGKDIEPLKKSLHYALYFADYSLGKALGFDFSFMDEQSTIQKKYIALCAYFDQMGGVFRGSLPSTLANGKTQLNTHLQSYTAARRCSWSITTARSGYGKSMGGG